MHMEAGSPKRRRRRRRRRRTGIETWGSDMISTEFENLTLLEERTCHGA